MSTAPLFPMFLKLSGRPCLVVGAGSIGEPKIRSLVDCGAEVCVVAPAASPAIAEAAALGKLVWRQKNFESHDLEGVFLAVAATSSAGVNHAIYQEAQRRGVLCNVVDDPPHCDFFYPAIVRRGHFQIAISTGGLSPALAQRLRKQLEAEFPPVYGEWLEQLGNKRAAFFKQAGDPKLRRSLIHESVTSEAFAQFDQDRQLNGEAGVLHVDPGEDVQSPSHKTGKELL
jgi:precorrin-2 dehydrogenase/sirohydrochlorin ferrochelatase